MSTPLSNAAARAANSPASPAGSLRHGRFEDAQALFTGSLFVSITMMLFAQAGLLTGSTAGVAFLLHYATGLPFGVVFFAINLPFYWFAWRRMGAEFTVKTFVSVAMLALLVDWGPRFIHIDYLNPLFAAVLGGLLMGAGCLFLARAWEAQPLFRSICRSATVSARARCRWRSTAPWCCLRCGSCHSTAWPVRCSRPW